MSLFEKIAKIMPGKKPENETYEQNSIYGSADNANTNYSGQSVGQSPANLAKNQGKQLKAVESQAQKKAEPLKKPQNIKTPELKSEKNEKAQINKKAEENSQNNVKNENKNFIETDFDRVVSYITQHGKASFTQISKDLGLSWNRIEECSNILRNEKQIEIIYLPFGDPIATVVGYSEKIREKDLRRRKVA